MVQVQVHGELAAITGYPYVKIFYRWQQRQLLIDLRTDYTGSLG